jgi:ABC-type maltose transport system permease subunit
MLSTSIKPDGSEFEFPIRWIPDQIAWDNYVRAFKVKTLTFVKNTLIVSLVSLVGEIFTASLAAYGFARGCVSRSQRVVRADAEHAHAAVHRHPDSALCAVPARSVGSTRYCR